MLRSTILLFFIPFTCLLAQEQTGTLEGNVTDSSGAGMPGAIVTVSGSTILGGSRTATTSQTGAYRLSFLPIGSYEVKFEHPGFTTHINKDVRVQADATFTLNVTLSLSAVATSVEVVSSSPMIETSATDVTFSFNKDILDKVPNARDPWAIMNQAPGIVSDSVNVGGSQTGNQPTFRGHGADPTQATYMFNGANVTDNTDNGASQFYFDVDSFSEMQVEVNAHGADVQTPGIVLNIVPKSGTNALHGSASFFYDNDNMEWSNLDSHLRSLGGTPSNQAKYYDGGLEAGGPIIRNKLFIWGAYRYQDIERFITGTQNPNGSYPIDRSVLWFPSAKLDWQVTPKHHFSSFFNMQQKERFNRGLSALVPVVSTWNQAGDPIARLFTFRDDWMVTNKLVLSFKANIMDQGFSLSAQPGVNVATTATRYDLATGAYAAAPPYVYGIAKTLRAGGISGSYYGSNFLGGSHELKFGFDLNDYHVAGNQGGGALYIYPGSAQLQFLNGVPTQVVVYAPGTESVSNPTRSVYVQDGWKLRRWRFDLGLRWDRQGNSLDAATAPASLYFPAVTQAATGNLITWNTFAPRVGVIYDVTGKAKSLLKASYNRYYYQLWTNLGAETSTAGVRSYTYQWSPPAGDCVGGLTSTNCTFNPSQEGKLLSENDPALNPVTVNSNLKPTRTDEVIAGFSQELLPNLAVQATFIYRLDRDLTWLINPNITPSAYSPVTGTDPVTGNSLTFFALNPADVSLSPNYVTNRPGFSQEYEGFEVQAIRRFTNRFQLTASYTRGVQKENYGAGSYLDPQDITFLNGTRVPFSRPNIAKLIGSYSLPHNFMVAWSYGGYSGANYTRTINSNSVLATHLPQGNVAVLSGERNVNSYPFLNILDMRLSYDQKIGERKISYYLDIFNLLNINTIDSMQTITGATYGNVLDYIPPRILRLGVKFVF